MAWFMPTPMLFSRAFLLKDSAVFFFLREEATRPSANVTITPLYWGALLMLIGSIRYVLCSVTIDMKGVGGSGRGGKKGSVLIGRGWVLLSPDPIPYLLREGDALQHAMYWMYFAFVLFGTSPAGTWVFANLHSSFQQYPLVCQRGNMKVPFHFTPLLTHLPWNVFPMSLHPWFWTQELGWCWWVCCSLFCRHRHLFHCPFVSVLCSCSA